MRRFAQVMKWLWGTSWPLYAATVLGSNVLGALAIMLLIPSLYLVKRTMKGYK